MNRALSPPPIVLVGFMGAGKSSVGRALAKRLGRSFVDLDTIVERKARKTIADIFSTLGEAAFRRLESEALDAVLSGEPAGVIALGGGAYPRSENRVRIARSGGRVVCLEVSLEEAIRRIDPDSHPNAPEPGGAVRPLAVDRDRMARLFAERLPVYRQAHLCLDTTNRSVEAVVEELAVWVVRTEQRREAGARIPTETGSE